MNQHPRKWRDWKNLHHICGKSYDKYFYTNLPQNHLIMDYIKHDWLNNLFWALQTPQQQLEYLTENVRKKVLSKQSYEILQVLMNMDLDEFYDPKLVKWTKGKQNRHL